MASKTPSEVALEESRAHTDSARRKLGRIERRSASPPGFKFDDEDTINKIVDGVAKRQKQQSQPEIHVHVGDSKPDGDPSESGDESGFSVEGPLGWQVRARGRIAWAVVALLALLALGVLAGRLTAPRHERPHETPVAPK